MGNIARKYCAKVDAALETSKKIDKDILNEVKNEPDEIEVLLLGAPGSGKSTILKQIRLIHYKEYSLEERLMFKPIIFANAIQCMSAILHAMEMLGKGPSTDLPETYTRVHTGTHVFLCVHKGTHGVHTGTLG